MSQHPAQLASALYFCLVYELSHQKRVLGMRFVKCGRNQADTFSTLRNYFANVIANRWPRDDGMTINSLLTVVACKVGYCAYGCRIDHASLNFKGSSIRTAELSDFRAEPGLWKCIF